MAVSSTLTLTQTIPQYYEKKLLDRLEANLQYYEFADKKPIPAHGGKIITFTRYTNFAAQTTTLTEGVTPTALQMSATNVTATLAQYGAWTNPTDFLSLVAIDEVSESSSELLGYNAGLSVDTLVRNVLSGGTEQLADGVAAVSSLAATNVLDGAEVRKAVRTLTAADVRTHKKTPGFYVGLIHPNTKYDLCGDTATGSWVDVRKYTESGNKNIELYKVGDLYQVRFFETSNLQTLSSTVQTYNNVIFGDNAYACAEINRNAGRGAKNPKIIIKALGSAGADDPLNQRASIGWIADFVPFLLDAARVIVVKTGASA